MKQSQYSCIAQAVTINMVLKQSHIHSNNAHDYRFFGFFPFHVISIYLSPESPALLSVHSVNICSIFQAWSTDYVRTWQMADDSQLNMKD